MVNSCRLHIALVTAICTVVGAAAGTPGASAAPQRYASPTGAGNECSSVHPCRVDWAINGAGSGDEVIVKPGNFYVSYSIKNTVPVSVHGVAGQPRPTLYLSGNSSLQLDSSELSYLEVVQSTPNLPALAGVRSKFDRLILRGGQSANCAEVNNQGEMSNSIVVARNPSGDAICSPSSWANGSSTYRNVTAIAQGGTAVWAFTTEVGADLNVQAVNVIAQTDPGGYGFEATNNLGGHATITVSHSNYANSHATGANALVVSAGGNQGTPPEFIDAAGGDYHQRPGSVTIDAGLDAAQNGLFDVDGDSRSVARTDIGADELAPAPAGGDPAPTSPPAGGGGGTPTAGAFAGVKLVSSALTLKRGRVVVKLSCPATAGRCTGVTRLTARRKPVGSRAASTVKLGRARFSIAPGGQKKLKVRVSRAGRRLFAHKRRLRGRAASAAHDAAGLSKTTSSRVTIRKGTR